MFDTQTACAIIAFAYVLAVLVAYAVYRARMNELDARELYVNADLSQKLRLEQEHHAISRRSWDRITGEYGKLQLEYNKNKNHCAHIEREYNFLMNNYKQLQVSYEKLRQKVIIPQSDLNALMDEYRIMYEHAEHELEESQNTIRNLEADTKLLEIIRSEHEQKAAELQVREKLITERENTLHPEMEARIVSLALAMCDRSRVMCKRYRGADVLPNATSCETTAFLHRAISLRRESVNGPDSEDEEGAEYEWY